MSGWAEIRVSNSWLPSELSFHHAIHQLPKHTTRRWHQLPRARAKHTQGQHPPFILPWQDSPAEGLSDCSGPACGLHLDGVAPMYRQSDDYGFFAKRVFIVHNRAQQPTIGGHTLSFSILRRLSPRDTAAVSDHCVGVVITRPTSLPVPYLLLHLQQSGVPPPWFKQWPGQPFLPSHRIF